jgi:dolichyl-phosphooligosaccharide-protein glycotransferase
MFARLYFANGTAEHLPGAPDAALERFRLVYASPHYRQDPVRGAVSSYKIFEHVPGALVSGSAGPESRVQIRLILRDPQGGRLEYSDVTRATRDGSYSFHVPYATDAGSGDFSPTGAYELTTGGKTSLVQVPEHAVQTGGTVPLR